MFGIPKTLEELAELIATIPNTSDIRIEGDCVHYLYNPPPIPQWIHLGPITLQPEDFDLYENNRA